MGFMKNHPFAVEAYFKHSLVLTFAIPRNQLLGMIPNCLELDDYQGKWAFVAVAMVQVTGLRPKGFHKLFGRDFFLIGYRVFVKYTNLKGKRLRGLYILKSETDSKLMRCLGSLFTSYKYTLTQIKQTNEDYFWNLSSKKSQFTVTIDKSSTEVSIPEGSPFLNWKDARKFAGPLPHTFSYDIKRNTVIIIRGLRQNWKPNPVNISFCNFKFLNSMEVNMVVLASAFEIKNIPYFWEKGKLEKWS